MFSSFYLLNRRQQGVDHFLLCQPEAECGGAAAGSAQPEGTDGEFQIDNLTFPNDRVQILKKIGSFIESPSFYPNLTGKENLEVNVPNCTGTPDDKTKVGVAADPDNDKILVISGKNVGTTTVKVTTPGGQTICSDVFIVENLD